MNINNLKLIRNNIEIELSLSLKEHGTENYQTLCQLRSILDLLINNLEFPEHNKKLKRLMNPDGKT